MVAEYPKALRHFVECHECPENWHCLAQGVEALCSVPDTSIPNLAELPACLKPDKADSCKHAQTFRQYIVCLCPNRIHLIELVR